MAKAMTAGKAKGSGAPRKAPKVAPPNPINGNYMKEAGQAGTKGRLMAKKRLSK
tara:strand:+ start:53 stop:214 length:162 start_codon:yes stop_codon:yes gene_type:complete